MNPLEWIILKRPIAFFPSARWDLNTVIVLCSSKIFITTFLEDWHYITVLGKKNQLKDFSFLPLDEFSDLLYSVMSNESGRKPR